MKAIRLFTAIVLAMLTAFSHADQPEGATINLGLGYIGFDSDRNLDNTPGGALGVGYRFASPWAVELSYLNADTETGNGSSDVDIDQWRLDGLYHLETIAKIEPFFAFGVGRADIDANQNDKAQSLINAGVGAKYWFRDNTAFRGDFRFFRTSDDSDMDSAFVLSFHHRIGEPRAASKPMAAAPLDSDGDGVMDDQDQCPQTPSQASVDGQGCAIDSDRDGVADYKDACPDTTQRGAKIDSRGCYEMLKETVSVELSVEFDYDSAKARPEHRGEVKRVVDFMAQYPKTKVTIEGHTDSRGQAAYNKDLSQRRADTIANMLTGEFNISSSRVAAKGYGEERPIASNDTDAGRQANRRVVGVVETDIEKVANQ